MAKNIFDKPVPEIQRREMRRAFYAGAATMHGVNAMIGEESVSEDEGVEIYMRISDELAAYAREIMAGKA